MRERDREREEKGGTHGSGWWKAEVPIVPHKSIVDGMANLTGYITSNNDGLMIAPTT